MAVQLRATSDLMVAVCLTEYSDLETRIWRRKKKYFCFAKGHHRETFRNMLKIPVILILKNIIVITLLFYLIQFPYIYGQFTEVE